MLAMYDPTPPPHVPRTGRPGRTCLRLGGIFLGISLLMAVILGLVTYFLILRSFDHQRIVAPGTDTFQIERTGSYRIFHEHSTTLNGRSIRQTTPPDGLEVQLLDPRGQQVSLSPSSGETYSYMSSEGTSLFSFDAPHVGTYTLTATLEDGDPGPVVLTIGRGMMRFVGGLFAVICGGFITVPLAIAGIILLIIGLVQRSSAPRPHPTT
jgi:hypothetical protein